MVMTHESGMVTAIEGRRYLCFGTQSESFERSAYAKWSERDHEQLGLDKLSKVQQATKRTVVNDKTKVVSHRPTVHRTVLYSVA
jgi:hypothetical protein